MFCGTNFTHRQLWYIAPSFRGVNRIMVCHKNPEIGLFDKHLLNSYNCCSRHCLLYQWELDRWYHHNTVPPNLTDLIWQKFISCLYFISSMGSAETLLHIVTEGSKLMVTPSYCSNVIQNTCLLLARKDAIKSYSKIMKNCIWTFISSVLKWHTYHFHSHRVQNWSPHLA